MEQFYDSLVYPRDYPIPVDFADCPVIPEEDDLPLDEEDFTLEWVEETVAIDEAVAATPEAEKQAASFEDIIRADVDEGKEVNWPTLSEELDVGPVDAEITNKEIFKLLELCPIRTENWNDTEIGQYVPFKYIQDWFPLIEIRGSDFYPLENGGLNYNAEMGTKIAIALAMCLGYLPAVRDCSACGGSMLLELFEEKNEKGNLHYCDPFRWRCRNNGQWYKAKHIAKPKCQKRLSIREGTWMASLNTPIVNILQVIYHKLEGGSLAKIMKESKVAESSVVKITKIVRLLGANFMLAHPTLNKIGGLDKDGNPMIVQLDESCVGKRKNHKGKLRPTIWVLGAVETSGATPFPRVWVMTVPNRSRATLIPVLKYKIHQESICHSDGWSAYYILGQHFQEWDWVNHKYYFKDPVSKVHTNNMEGLWTWLKKDIPRGARRPATEEYCQFWNFKQYVRNIPAYKQIGLFGMVGRISRLVALKDLGPAKKRVPGRIPNMSMASNIVSQFPYEEPVASSEAKPSGRRPGRPVKRQRRERCPYRSFEA